VEVGFYDQVPSFFKRRMIPEVGLGRRIGSAPDYPEAGPLREDADRHFDLVDQVHRRYAAVRRDSMGSTDAVQPENNQHKLYQASIRSSK